MGVYMKRVRFIVEVGLIAAMYAALTMLFAPISYGQIQVRISEALTILPFFTPAAIPGLAIGCLFSNFLSGFGIIDIIFGTLATLIAAVLTYYMPKKWLAPLPPVIVNGIIVGFVLNYVADLPLFITMLWVGFGELIACYLLGYPLLLSLEKNKDRIFKK